MAPTFTARQGQYLAFIHRYTARHGVAPSFEDIATHFGTTAPSVNGMIKTLERRGLLSRMPGVARSLRVLVPSSELTESDFGRRGGGVRKTRSASGGAVSAQDAAVTAALAVLERLLPRVPAEEDLDELVLRAAEDVWKALIAGGLSSEAAREVAAHIAAAVARWRRDGRGTIVRRRSWQRR
jgi:repressor LexA